MTYADRLSLGTTEESTTEDLMDVSEVVDPNGHIFAMAAALDGGSEPASVKPDVRENLSSATTSSEDPITVSPAAEDSIPTTPATPTNRDALTNEKQCETTTEANLEDTEAEKNDEAFPLTGTWHILYRNYEEDPVFGTDKCLKFNQENPATDGEYPVTFEFGQGSEPIYASATFHFPELKPELEKYQDTSEVYPITEPFYELYRNYDEDPFFGTAKCVRFSQVGPEEDRGYPILAQWGEDNQSMMAYTELESSEGYTIKNKAVFTVDGVDGSLPFYVTFLEVGNCGVIRNAYMS
ncbi:hypothetical protein HPB47_021550, partial [Ixodes persulcatus]